MVILIVNSQLLTGCPLSTLGWFVFIAFTLCHIHERMMVQLTQKHNLLYTHTHTHTHTQTHIMLNAEAIK